MRENQGHSMLIAQMLRRKFNFEQVKFNMYLENDIYNRIPSLIFRLQDKNQYSEIKTCIENFSGILKWTLYRYEFSRKENYVIAPQVLYEIEKNYTDTVSNEKEVIPKGEYETVCENAIMDIPHLAEYIQKYFNIKNCTVVQNSQIK